MTEDREWMRDDFERDDNNKLQQAYDQGYEDGYRKAMKEAHSMGNRGDYGERMDAGYQRKEDGYGERRGVPGTGPYSRRR
jgi:hypothetical protein